VVPCEKGTFEGEPFLAVKHVTLEVKAVLHCLAVQLDRPSLRAVTCTPALRFVTLSLSLAQNSGRSALESFARLAAMHSH